MNAWSGEELERAAAAEELELTAAGRAVTIWVVRLGDDVYVRSVRGRTSGWFQRVLESHEGSISAGGVTKDVTFVEVDDDTVNDAVGEAYRSKYGSRYPNEFIDPLLTPEARAATLRLVPRQRP